MGKPEKVRVNIVKEPGRCGGNATVGPTRITVWGIISKLRIYGSTAAFLEAEPHYTRKQVGAAKEYYRRNQREIDDCIRENKECGERLLDEQRVREATATATTSANPA